MDALPPQHHAVHDRIHVHPARHRETLGFSIRTHRPQFFIASRIRGAARIAWWNIDDAGSLHASCEFHTLRPDGRRILDEMGAERLLAESDRGGSVDLLLLRLPSDGCGRWWSLESRSTFEPSTSS